MLYVAYPTVAMCQNVFFGIPMDIICSYLVGGLEDEIYDFPYIGNVIIPTDFHIFQRGRYTTNQSYMFGHIPILNKHSHFFPALAASHVICI